MAMLYLVANIHLFYFFTVLFGLVPRRGGGGGGGGGSGSVGHVHLCVLVLSFERQVSSAP